MPIGYTILEPFYFLGTLTPFVMGMYLHRGRGQRKRQACPRQVKAASRITTGKRLWKVVISQVPMFAAAERSNTA